MLKEYLNTKIEELNCRKTTLATEIGDLQKKSEKLRHKIIEDQENINIDYEIFSPRMGKYLSKENLNKLYQQFEDINQQKKDNSEELEKIQLELCKFKRMLSELKDLENRANGK